MKRDNETKNLAFRFYVWSKFVRICHLITTPKDPGKCKKRVYLIGLVSPLGG